jgi:hypothetical protein
LGKNLVSFIFFFLAKRSFIAGWERERAEIERERERELGFLKTLNVSFSCNLAILFIF